MTIDEWKELDMEEVTIRITEITTGEFQAWIIDSEGDEYLAKEWSE